MAGFRNHKKIVQYENPRHGPGRKARVKLRESDCRSGLERNEYHGLASLYPFAKETPPSLKISWQSVEPPIHVEQRRDQIKISGIRAANGHRLSIAAIRRGTTTVIDMPIRHPSAIPASTSVR